MALVSSDPTLPIPPLKRSGHNEFMTLSYNSELSPASVNENISITDGEETEDLDEDTDEEVEPGVIPHHVVDTLPPQESCPGTLTTVNPTVLPPSDSPTRTPIVPPTVTDIKPIQPQTVDTRTPSNSSERIRTPIRILNIGSVQEVPSDKWESDIIISSIPLIPQLDRYQRLELMTQAHFEIHWRRELGLPHWQSKPKGVFLFQFQLKDEYGINPVSLFICTQKGGMSKSLTKNQKCFVICSVSPILDNQKNPWTWELPDQKSTLLFYASYNNASYQLSSNGDTDIAWKEKITKRKRQSVEESSPSSLLTKQKKKVAGKGK